MRTQVFSNSSFPARLDPPLLKSRALFLRVCYAGLTARRRRTYVSPRTSTPWRSRTRSASSKGRPGSPPPPALNMPIVSIAPLLALLRCALVGTSRLLVFVACSLLLAGVKSKVHRWSVRWCVLRDARLQWLCCCDHFVWCSPAAAVVRSQEFGWRRFVDRDAGREG